MTPYAASPNSDVTRPEIDRPAADKIVNSVVDELLSALRQIGLSSIDDMETREEIIDVLWKAIKRRYRVSEADSSINK